MPRVTALVVAVMGGLLLPAVVQAASVVDDNRNLRFTASIQDQSIREALDAVALLAGRQIKVMGLIEDRMVSVTLNSATLAESIDKVLSTSNYIIVWSDEEELVILMLDRNGEPAFGGTGSFLGEGEDIGHGLVSLFPDGPEVLPPNHPGEDGLTLADIEYYWSLAPDLDPSEVDVFPTSPGEDRFTEQDLADLIANQEPLPPDTNLFPRDSAGNSVFTIRDAEIMRSSMSEALSSEVAFWMEGDSGSPPIPVTFDQLTPDPGANIIPENLADLFPPPDGSAK